MKIFRIFKKREHKLPTINVPERYQPFNNVSLDRNHPERMKLKLFCPYCRAKTEQKEEQESNLRMLICEVCGRISTYRLKMEPKRVDY